MSNNKKSLVFPPPNITGSLHIGHGFQQVLMDIIFKHYLFNKNIKINWVPGTDHSGIAAYILASKMDNPNIQDNLETLKQNSIRTIRYQMQRLSINADFDKEMFTLDLNYKQAVNHAFKILYNNGLIYKGQRVTYWDSIANTTVSDVEIKYKKQEGYLFFIKYIMVDNPSVSLIVATTRPETIYADKALAVNPLDKRYLKYIGKQFIVPITGHIIKLIADELVDQEFGTGVLKVTPSHCLLDQTIAIKHNLEHKNIIDTKGLFNCYPIVGLNVHQARSKTLYLMEQENLIVDKKEHIYNIPFNERTGCNLELILTNQWFIKSSELAKKALTKVQDNNVQFFPNNYYKICKKYLSKEFLQDWCISRQIPWGHRIPIWYDQDGNQYDYPLENGEQDSDVLDTWFSSSIWPLVSNGWPKNIDKENYNNSFVITGEDILFFWVNRMLMICTYITDSVPFKEVFITGIIRDKDGTKMSKSKGNVIDFIDLIDGISINELCKKRTQNIQDKSKIKLIKDMTIKQWPKGIQAYGTDVVRFAFAYSAVISRNITIDQQILDKGKYLFNKIKNALIFGTIIKDKYSLVESKLDPITEWFLFKLSYVENIIDTSIENYRFDTVAQQIYKIISQDFCSYYLEFIKATINKEKAYNFCYVLNRLTKIIYPVMPYISTQITTQFENINTLEKYYQGVKIDISEIKSAIDTINSIKQQYKTVQLLTTDNLNEYTNIFKSMLKIDVKQINIPFTDYILRYISNLMPQILKIVFNKSIVYKIGQISIGEKVIYLYFSGEK